MVIISLGEDLPYEVPRSKGPDKTGPPDEESKGREVTRGHEVQQAVRPHEPQERPAKAAVKAEVKPSASKRAGSAKKDGAKAKEGKEARPPEAKSEAKQKKAKDGKENKEVLQLGKLDDLQLEVRRAGGEPVDTGVKQLRAALFELTTAFQAGNKAAAFQALGQLAGNPQGRPAASASIETHMTPTKLADAAWI
ncbi:SETD3 [Symbiodinium natans]|uniref:SETD3 protein n=1 Tax=Symbiodinium natans TaxID=878477 RepID=A0A812QTQ7_9DINO|nr:SETD3 [Symbiodinium natans]